MLRLLAVDVPAMSAAASYCNGVPVFDHELGLLQCIEDLAVEQFIAQLVVASGLGPLVRNSISLK